MSLFPGVSAKVVVRDAANKKPIDGALLFVRPLPILQKYGRKEDWKYLGEETNYELEDDSGLLGEMMACYESKVPTFDSTASHAQCNSDGQVVLQGLPVGIHRLYVVAPGYVIKRIDLFELPLDQSQFQVEMNAGEHLRTKVVDAFGNALANWGIQFSSTRYHWLTKTDAQGNASSMALPAGANVKVAVPHVIRENEPELRTSDWLSRGFAGNKVRLPHAGVLELQVPTDCPMNLPVHVSWQGADPDDQLQMELIIVNDNDPGFGFPVHTIFHSQVHDTCSAQGSSGSCILGARIYHPHQVVALGTKSGIWRSSDIDVGGEEARQVVLREEVSRVSSLAGQVHSESAEALAGAKVSLFMQRSPQKRYWEGCTDSITENVVFSTHADASGKYSMSSLLPGLYTIAASHGGSLTMVDTVQIKTGDNAADLVLKPGGHIAGRVQNHRPNQVMVVRAQSLEDSLEKNVLVAGNGEFIIPELPEGSYFLKLQPAYPPGELTEDDMEQEFERLTTRNSSAKVEVVSGKEFTCTLKLKQSRRNISVSYSGSELGQPLEVLLDRLYTYDRMGYSCVLYSKPLGRTGRTELKDHASSLCYGLIVRNRESGKTIAWGSIPRGSDSVVVNLGSEPHATVTCVLRVAAEHAALVPLHDEGTPLRNTFFRPVSQAGNQAVFRSIPYGRYLAVPKLKGDYLGPIDRSEETGVKEILVKAPEHLLRF